MTDRSSYEILQDQISSPLDRAFVKALDAAIAEENAKWNPEGLKEATAAAKGTDEEWMAFLISKQVKSGDES